MRRSQGVVVDLYSCTFEREGPWKLLLVSAEWLRSDWCIRKALSAMCLFIWSFPDNLGDRRGEGTESVWSLQMSSVTYVSSCVILSLPGLFSRGACQPGGCTYIYINTHKVVIDSLVGVSWWYWFIYQCKWNPCIILLEHTLCYRMYMCFIQHAVYTHFYCDIVHLGWICLSSIIKEEQWKVQFLYLIIPLAGLFCQLNHNHNRTSSSGVTLSFIILKWATIIAIMCNHVTSSV